MRRVIKLILIACLAFGAERNFPKRVFSTVEVGPPPRLEVDLEGCSVYLSIPEEVHKVLIREFGPYRVLTEFNSGFYCSQMHYFVGENFTPWVAIGDFNGDGRKDMFLRILWGEEKKVTEVFLISEGESYRVVRTADLKFVPGRSNYSRRPARIFSPCRFEDRFEYGYLTLHFSFDCLEMRADDIDYFTWILIYTNGAFSEIEIFLGD